MKYGRAKHPLEVQMKAMTTRAVLRDIRGLNGCTMAMYLFKGKRETVNAFHQTCEAAGA
jgi:hypothetical protein